MQNTATDAAILTSKSFWAQSPHRDASSAEGRESAPNESQLSGGKPEQSM